MSKKLLFRLTVLVTAMMCTFGASAAEAYACYTSSNTTLTFYYDTQRSSRTGTTYDLNTGSQQTGWYVDETYSHVTQVVIDPSFVEARPTSTYMWFYGMENVHSITGLNYLNTESVTNMAAMFMGCSGLTSLDLSHFNTTAARDMFNMFNECSNLTSLDVSSFNTAGVQDMRGMFRKCGKLTILDLSSFNTAMVEIMIQMFSGDTQLVTIYVGQGWSTESLNYSYEMFENCTSLVGGQGTTYDESHVNAAYAHIDGGPTNPGYFTRDPNSPEAYACYTPSNTTLTFYYDTERSSRTGTTYDLNTGSQQTGWYVDETYSHVTQVVIDPSFVEARPTSTYMWFYGMENVHSITGLNYLNTENVTNMGAMFMGCTVLASLDLSSFNTANVTGMSCMFLSCYALTSLDVSNFNTAKVTNMHEMFAGCSGLTSLDLSSFNTANVTNMRYMFSGCSGLTSLDVSSFNIENVVYMLRMFSSCSGLKTIYVGDGWSTAAVTESTDMFYNCTRLVGGMGTTYDANHTDKTYAHIDGGPSNPGYFTGAPEAYACYTPSNTTLTFYYDNQRASREGTTCDLNTGNNEPEWCTNSIHAYVTQVVFDPSFAEARPTTTCYWFSSMERLQNITGMEYLNTSEVTNMAYMFNSCRKLTTLDLSHFNTSNVTSMEAMFSSCHDLTNLDLTSFNTDNVTTMYCMFNYSDGLTSVDLSSFTNARVSRTSNMFEGCSALTTIYASSSWYLPSNNYSWAMFMDCTSLVGGMGTTYDEDHSDGSYAHIDDGPSNPGYFTEKANFERGDVNGDGQVKINDVTALIDYLLSGDGSSINVDAADCNQDGQVKINDVTALIDYLLSGTWN